MREIEYVYCTQCKHFRLDDEDTPYCPYEDECDIWDCEDSRRYAERPCYEENNCDQPCNLSHKIIKYKRK